MVSTIRPVPIDLAETVGCVTLPLPPGFLCLIVANLYCVGSWNGDTFAQRELAALGAQVCQIMLTTLCQINVESDKYPFAELAIFTVRDYAELAAPPP